MAFKKIEPKIWKPEKEGDCIEGILVERGQNPSYENTQIYCLSISPEIQITVYGTTILDDRMRYIKIGNKVKIVFQGIIKNKKNQDTKSFDVFLDDGLPEVVKV